MSSIPGLEHLAKEGWEVVEFDYASHLEWCVNCDGDIEHWISTLRSSAKRLIIRKIEKPKQYRAFANAAEYEPHRDRWVEYTSPNCDYSMYQISAYSSQRVWLGPNATGIEYREAFHCLKFDDGTPFGVEVTS